MRAARALGGSGLAMALTDLAAFGALQNDFMAVARSLTAALGGASGSCECASMLAWLGCAVAGRSNAKQRLAAPNPASTHEHGQLTEIIRLFQA